MPSRLLETVGSCRKFVLFFLTKRKLKKKTKQIVHVFRVFCTVRISEFVFLPTLIMEELCIALFQLI